MPTERKSLAMPRTADAEQIQLTFGGEDGDTLVVSFKDWREQLCSVTFKCVLVFRWLRDELFSSELLKRAVSSDSVELSNKTYRHYRSGFNVRSAVLEVVATEMIAAPQS